ncbi:hypothetical protein GM3708_3234 [Geminocystis sp. NIES-3708]|uniref:glycosyltransferase family 2 protein n=1 Tax=Geminocystis sp. NIES-3708 TaxID=1615909 RepID=UPI0005FC537D|nr:glycosyltransferase family A protein [Geminocystis sp. NIES-3708]BAQ62828.1 hypothetical protein GM3708_3234 [Geminocystis sp. NIES-3708]
MNTPFISIGILAYNESCVITKMLKSLFAQSIFQNHSFDKNIEIIVVPNGCTDNTGSVADHVLKSWQDKLLSSHNVRISYQIQEVTIAGKSNSWNLYIHNFSDKNAKYLFLADADIEFLNKDTLANMINTLENKPQTNIVVDKPVKDISVKENRNFVESISTIVSGKDMVKNQRKNEPLCGQLYGGRSSILRQIWMPPELLVEDGFLHRMIVTDLFTQNNFIPERIIVAENASHIFEAYTTISSLIRHEKRLIWGSIINSFIFDYLWEKSQAGENIGLLIKQNNEQNPLWLRELITQRIEQEGWWLISSSRIFRRFKSFSSDSFFRQCLFLPMKMIAFIFDLLVYISTNQDMKRKNYWESW